MLRQKHSFVPLGAFYKSSGGQRAKSNFNTQSDMFLKHYS